MTISGIFISADTTEFGVESIESSPDSTERETVRQHLARRIDALADWKAFEQSGSTFVEMNDPTLMKCDELVRESLVVVQLVGHRAGDRINARSFEWLCRSYGARLTKRFGFLEALLRDEHRTISYTQWEAWLALLHGKNLLLYQSGDAAKGVDHGSLNPGNSVVSCVDHVAMLRKANVYVAGTFSTFDLAGKVLPALHRFSKRTYELPAPIDFASYAFRKREDFIGRRWLLERLDHWADTSTSRSLLLIGEFGYGKSAFVAQLLDAWQDRRRVVHHFCRYDDDMTLRPGCIVRSLAAQFRTIIDDYRQLVESNLSIQEHLKEAESKPIEAMRVAVLNPLCGLDHQQSACFLIIDGLDEALDISSAPGSDEHTLMDLIESAVGELPPWLHVFITSRPVAATRTDTVRNRFEVIDLDAEDREAQAEDLHEYILHRSTHPAIERFLALSHASIEALIQQLQRSRSTRFILVRSILDDIIAGHIAPGDLDRLPRGMSEFYEQAFRKRLTKARLSPAVLLDMLGVVVVARQPLAAESIAGVIGVGTALVHQVFGAFGGLLVHDASHGITLGHMSLEDWLRGHSGASGAGEFRIHDEESTARLARYCRQRTIEGLERAGVFRRYLRGFGVKLLLSLGDIDTAIRLLLQLRRESRDDREPDRLKPSQLQLQTRAALAALKASWQRIDDPSRPDERDRLLSELADIAPSRLHGLLVDKDYETGLYVPVIRTLITCQAAQWPAIKLSLFDVENENDLVFRNDIGVAYAQSWNAAGPHQREQLMTEIEGMTLAIDDDNEREIAGYAIKRICELYKARAWKHGYRQKIEGMALRFARAPAALDRMLGGEILLALVIHGEQVDRLFVQGAPDDVRFWDPCWPNQRTDVDAINTLLGRMTLNGRGCPDAARSFAEARGQYLHAEALRMKLRDAAFFENTPIGGDLLRTLESFASQYHDEYLFEEPALATFEKALKGPDCETVLDVFRLMLLHPLWNLIERATSVIAEVVKRDEKSIHPVLDGLANADIEMWRIRYGVIDAAYNCGNLDDYEKFFAFAYRFGRDPDCRIRGICADDIDGWVRHAHASLIRGRIETADFVGLLRFWVEHADDEWLLEYLHKIFRDLSSERKVPNSILDHMIDRRSRYLPPGRFYEMDLDDYLEHIEGIRMTEWHARPGDAPSTSS